jgi:hypothetical protein
VAQVVERLLNKLCPEFKFQYEKKKKQKNLLTQYLAKLES